jgi:hypothetical protein
MKPKKRQKLCYNCEGEIDLDVIVCPFCAADLRTEKLEQSQSVYQPFGTPEKLQNQQTSQSLYPSPFASRSEVAQDELEEELPFHNPEETVSNERLSRVIFPTILFTLGIQMFLLGMFILLFSHKGVVLLRWDGTFWFFYVLASCPLLYFGYRSLSKID